MWNLPGPGIKPASPALVVRFLTTGLPRKPSCVCACPLPGHFRGSWSSGQGLQSSTLSPPLSTFSSQTFRCQLSWDGPYISSPSSTPAKPCLLGHLPGCPLPIWNSSHPQMNSASSLPGSGEPRAVSHLEASAHTVSSPWSPSTPKSIWKTCVIHCHCHF